MLLNEADDLVKNNNLHEALKKYMEFIKMEPLDVYAHFQIGKLYKTLAKTDNEKKENDYLEEAILHFEQVIKHNEHNKKAILHL